MKDIKDNTINNIAITDSTKIEMFNKISHINDYIQAWMEQKEQIIDMEIERMGISITQYKDEYDRWCIAKDKITVEITKTTGHHPIPVNRYNFCPGCGSNVKGTDFDKFGCWTCGAFVEAEKNKEKDNDKKE